MRESAVLRLAVSGWVGVSFGRIGCLNVFQVRSWQTGRELSD